MSTARKPIIVVGVSGSSASGAALRWAADEADRRHGQLRVVLIWSRERRALYAPAVGSLGPGTYQQRARQVLAAAIRAVLGPVQQANVIAEVVEGAAERVLVDLSAGADLLVLGSASGFVPERSIGPVVRTCLSHAHCPVVVVGPEGPPWTVAEAAEPTAEADDCSLAELASSAGLAASKSHGRRPQRGCRREATVGAGCNPAGPASRADRWHKAAAVPAGTVPAPRSGD
jgi:nucleotide-binding universal stress UspA family protein